MTATEAESGPVNTVRSTSVNESRSLSGPSFRGRVRVFPFWRCRVSLVILSALIDCRVFAVDDAYFSVLFSAQQRRAPEMPSVRKQPPSAARGRCRLDRNCRQPDQWDHNCRGVTTTAVGWQVGVGAGAGGVLCHRRWAHHCRWLVHVSAMTTFGAWA